MKKDTDNHEEWHYVDDVLPEKIQIEFKWNNSNYRLDIPLENIHKIEVKVESVIRDQGILDQDSMVMLIHLRKPVTVYGEVKDGKTKNPCVSPFDLSYSQQASPAC